MEKHVVTAALIYANGPVHLGHMVEYIQTDIYVRYLKLMGNDVIYCCAEDTHGAPIEIRARQEGISPEHLIEKCYREHAADFQTFDVAFDSFYSTHSPENRELTNLFFSRARESGHIESRRVELTYCEHCGRFLPDRYVRGTCPRCHAADQYGDQCETCSAAYRTTDLADARCAQCGHPATRRESDHYFFKVGDFTDRLRQWFDSMPGLQGEVRNYLENWMSEGLRDWDVTRDAPYFGFEIPGDPGKYYYVWVDAPIGYIASTKHYCDAHNGRWEAYWLEPGSRITHFIGKDIIYFHFLFWPAMLMAAGFNLPSDVIVHGFLTVQGQKMSKSRGSFVTAREYCERGGNPTYLRFYYATTLARNLNNIDLEPEDFKSKINSVLIGNVANFVNRTLTFLKKNFEGAVAGGPDAELESLVAPKRSAVLEYYGRVNYRDAVKTILEISDAGNRYIQSREPWKKIHEDRDAAQRVLSAGVHVVRDLAALLKPVVPSFCREVERQLGLPEIAFKDLGASLDGHRISDAAPILTRIEKLTVFEPDVFSLLDIRVARIESVEPHPKADKLWVLKIDAGTEKRQLVAGLRQHYSQEELAGKTVVFLKNLKPAKLRGLESQGMVLAAEEGDRVGVLLADAEPGTRVLVQGQDDAPASEIDLDTFISAGLQSRGDRVLFGEQPLRAGKDMVRADRNLKGKVR